TLTENFPAGLTTKTQRAQRILMISLCSLCLCGSSYRLKSIIIGNAWLFDQAGSALGLSSGHLSSQLRLAVPLNLSANRHNLPWESHKSSALHHPLLVATLR